MFDFTTRNLKMEELTMKKLLTGILSFSVLSLVLAGCGAGEQPKEGAAGEAPKGEPTKLVISTWGFSEDFFRKEVYEPFEKEHNVKIVLEIGNNAERLNKIRQGSSDVDLIAAPLKKSTAAAFRI
jgi:putative spermidine/putrescine transport system substrate-binding protein